LSLIPGKVQTLVEFLFTFVMDYIAETLESQKMARRFFPLLMTLFLFILFGNLFGLLPGVNSIVFGEGSHATALLHPISTDLNVTLALTIIAFLTIETVGIMTLGLLKYGGKFVNLKSPLAFLIGIIELFSELARLISFSFRLFGNMFAGKVLILIAVAFVPLFLPVPLMLFEVFVGFIQAAIFALLTLFFIKIAIMDPEEEHGDSHESERSNEPEKIQKARS
jgi:F-type H+-transporting ATPase subunit a